MFTTRDPFHADLIDALYPAADAARYELVLSAIGPGRDERRAAESLVDSRTEGLILLGSPRASKLALPAARPLVAVGWNVDDDSVDSVRTADDIGIGLAVDHLVELGHRAIVHVDGGRGAGATERRRGYRAAMRRRGLASEIRIVPGNYSENSGVRAAEELLSDKRRATAVIAANDRVAVGVIDTVRREGVSVPGELSVVGYDDSQLARLAHIDLTSVRQDATRMAVLAVEAAVSRLEQGRTDRLDAELEPHLVVRGTTTPTPA
jgi:DNA-binding LacI/PurR family transcriptional regulator